MDYYTANMAAWQVRDEGLEGSGAKLGEKGSEADGECEWILPSGGGKGVKGYGRCEGADAGSEKYDGTVL